MVDPDHARNFPHAPVDFVAAELAHWRSQRESQVVVDRHMRIERILLEDECDVPIGRSFACDVATAYLDAAAVGALQAGNEAQCRRLPGARWPEQDDELTVTDREVQISESLCIAKTLVEAFENDVSHAVPPNKVPKQWRGPTCNRTARAWPG